VNAPSVLFQVLFFPLFLFSLSAQADDDVYQEVAPLEIASSDVAGTTFSVMPYVAYENAVLRIAGPEGYALTIAFQGGDMIYADLLMDAEHRFSGQQLEHEEPRAWDTLPPGRYRYETVFDAASGHPQVHSGQFEIQ
jgi:hypothetical protein